MIVRSITMSTRVSVQLRTLPPFFFILFESVLFIQFLLIVLKLQFFLYAKLFMLLVIMIDQFVYTA